MAKEKSSHVGKWIVLILAGAILFFLILPFLDGSAGQPLPQRSDAKATPQIFTSNPLRRLAEKLLAAFSGKNKKHNNSLLAQGFDPQQEQEDALPLAAQRRQRGVQEAPAAETAAAATAPDAAAEEEEDFSAFVNDKGEWILVNQQDPITGIRGMHDIKSSDPAYERLVRMERQAKYTQPTAKLRTQKPESKWAKLLNPVKKLFGLEEEKQTLAALPLGGQTNSAAAARASRYPANLQQADLDEWSISKRPGGVRMSPEEVLSILALDPEEDFQKTADDLIKNAKKILNKKDADEHNKLIAAERRRLVQEMKNTILNQIAQDASRDEPDTDPATRLFMAAEETEGALNVQTCLADYSLPSAFYSKSDSCDSNQPSYYQHQEEATRQAKAESKNFLVQNSSSERIKQNGLQEGDEAPVTVVLSLSEPGKNPLLRAEKAESFDEIMNERYMNFLFAQSGCAKKSCALVASSDYAGADLTDSAESGFLHLVSFETQGNDQQFIKQIQEDQTLSEEDKAKVTQAYLNKMKPAYTLQPVERLSELIKESPRTKIYATSPSTAHALVQAGNVRGSRIFYSTEEHGWQQGTTPQQQGAAMAKAYNTNAERNWQLRKTYTDQLKKFSSSFVAKKAAEEAKKDFSSGKDTNFKL